MEFKGAKDGELYTITVVSGKVRSILVEKPNTWERKFYQRGPAKLGLTIDEKLFEKAVLAICQKNLVAWMGLYDALWNDKKYGQELQQEIFEKHLN